MYQEYLRPITRLVCELAAAEGRKAGYWHRQFPNRVVLLLLVALSACEFPTATPGQATPSPAVTAPSAPAPTSTLIPSPTSTPRPVEPTTVALPTPTYDPALSDWTLLIYLNADNELGRSGWRVINEMEAAGKNERVNIAVQIDRSPTDSTVEGNWSEARRYLISGDADSSRITSQLVMSLGEANMGDPAVLQDFVTWGIRGFPANRYALVIWDHGAGWKGVAFDEDVGFADVTDHISLADLREALAGAIDSTGIDRLDLVGFDAHLMGQAEVFHTLQPFADFAVASQDLLPGQGWDYKELLHQLYTDPAQDGSKLASQMVITFADFHRKAAPNAFFELSAIDLAQLPPIIFYLEHLALALAQIPGFMGGVVGEARAEVTTFARAYPELKPSYSTVDLYHFATILMERSLDEGVREMANDLARSIEAGIIAHESGPGSDHSGGIAIYFPKNGDATAPEYGRATDLPGWTSFLTSFHTVGLDQIPAPQIDFTSVITGVASVLEPAFLEFEIVARNLERVSVIGGRRQPEGREPLLVYEELKPEPRSSLGVDHGKQWRDGIHEDFYVWDTQATFLYDLLGNGDFVVMWPTESNGTRFAVSGRYRRSGAAGFTEASLLFNHLTGKQSALWLGENGLVTQRVPEAGDEFQPHIFYHDLGTGLSKQQGPSLIFDEQGQLYFERRPLPTGDYFLGLTAENIAGDRVEARTDLSVTNSDAPSQSVAYLDPARGFQFLYPASWDAPVYRGGILQSFDNGGATSMQTTIYPELRRGVSAEILTRQSLEQLGAVDILFPTQSTLIAGTLGQRTAYGYKNSEGSLRTGILLTFVANGDGFVVDVDGPSQDEEKTIALADQISDSWVFRQTAVGNQPGKWQTVQLDGLTIAHPSSTTYQEINGWQRFSEDRFTFAAFRSQPSTTSPADALAKLMHDAGEGVDDFNPGVSFEFPLSGRLWWRSDFSYVASSGEPIRGIVMVSSNGGRELAAWVEAPGVAFDTLESEVFLNMFAALNTDD